MVTSGAHSIKGRNVYAFLTLIDPSVMRDVLNTYLSQYNRDGFLKGNWDPYTPDAWSDQQWGFFSYFFLAAKLEGVTGVDYRAAEAAILQTMGMNATNMYLVREGFYKYGYIPSISAPSTTCPVASSSPHSCRDWRTSGTCSATGPRTMPTIPGARHI